MTHPPFEAPAPETMNRLLPAFEFKHLIASNDLGAVYMARQRSLERDVAVKLLSPRVCEDPAFRRSFEITARSMAKLNHPNLIGVFDSGDVEGMLYFIMEFVPGKSLYHSAAGQQVEISQAVRLIEGTCAGLAHAHGHRIVHGNLDPSDILLNQKAEPKIGNFGFTHPVETDTNNPCTAPEVLSGESPADARSDIFAVGAMLYQLITGKPHSPDAPPPSSLSKCTPVLDAIWRQATHTDPAQRFPDVVSFQKALHEGLQKSMVPVTARIPITAPLHAARKTGPAPVPAPARPPAARRGEVGLNWKLVRNLCIIAGLLYAISLAWDNLEKTRAQRDRDNKAALAKQAEDEKQAIADARKRAADRAARNTQPDHVDASTPVTPQPQPEKESPAESLARLGKSLAAGDRHEMPPGSIHQGDNDYLLFPEQMSWPEASAFAEQNGGHLAIPSAAANLTWLVQNVSSGNEVWLGAARSGRSEWSLVDGLAWKPKDEPSGTGPYLAADKHGFLRSEATKTRLPFIIQWHADGSNPGTLAAQLASTLKSLGGPSPIFPAGTRAFDNHRYLYVALPLAWRDAVDLAKTSGGHLAVASNTGEISNLREMTNDLEAPDGIWLGGSRKGDQWVWITGEPWKTAKWAADSEISSPDSALILRPGKGWDSQSSSHLASGFLIEWSNDHTSAGTEPTTKPGVGADVSALVTRATELIATADRKRSQALTANAQRFASELDVYLRSLPKGERSIRESHVSLLQASVKNNRVPSSVPRSSGIELSQKMADIAQSCSEKQDRIDADFLTEAERIRTAFIARIREMHAQAVQTGQRALAESLDETLAGAADLASWVNSLGVELKPDNPVPSRDERRKAPDNNGINRVRGNGGSLVE